MRIFFRVEWSKLWKLHQSQTKRKVSDFPSIYLSFLQSELFRIRWSLINVAHKKMISFFLLDSAFQWWTQKRPHISLNSLSLSSPDFGVPKYKKGKCETAQEHINACAIPKLIQRMCMSVDEMGLDKKHLAVLCTAF